MTADERHRVQSFLARFNRIDAQLRRKLGVSRQQGNFGSVVKRFTQEHPNLIDTDMLRTLAAIRNALVHETLGESDYCIVPTRSVIKQLDQLLEQLVAPLRVIPTFRTKVRTVSIGDGLIHVLGLIRQCDFSQFPVYDNSHFVGLLTENGITRWLATCGDGSAVANLDSIVVAQLLKREESDETCRVVAAAEEVQVVRAMFANQPLLEAVLITDSGHARSPLKGIITRWDMLR
jgi:predicted transcriptional regulator